MAMPSNSQNADLSETVNTESWTVQFEELKRQIGGISPFPNAEIDGFLSHFIIMIEFFEGPKAGQIVSISTPVAIQTVSRSSPFVYKGTAENHSVSIPLPQGSTLSNTISESDFLVRPNGFFQRGAEVVWMQILNLDARAEDTPIGPVRIILGETLKKEHPDLFQPSLGAAESLGRTGFPARLFFNPIAIIETDFGAFRAVHGTLAYGRITEFPPVGAAVSICDTIPMQPLDQVREINAGKRKKVAAPARIIALAHPIDVPMQSSPQTAFAAVEAMAAKGLTSKAKKDKK